MWHFGNVIKLKALLVKVLENNLTYVVVETFHMMLYNIVKKFIKFESNNKLPVDAAKNIFMHAMPVLKPL